MIDTNILVDLREQDPVWENWSYRAIADARLVGEVVASVLTIGELASRRGTLPELQELSAGYGVRILPLSVAAAHRAGEAQRAYRAAGGRREKLPVDFLIGGEACMVGAAMLTRDPRHYRNYFPELTLITPESNP